MNSADMQVIGICRFSYPALGGFQVDHPTVKEREAYLYDPARMEDRFRSFECLTLPPLTVQTDPDFTLIVVIGQSLPAPMRARLDGLLKGIPQAKIVAREPARHRSVMKQIMQEAREDRGVPSLQFRMDDDDAVSVRFVERLREAAQQLHGVIKRNRYVGIDFNHGYAVQTGPEGIRAKPCIETQWTPALGMAVSHYASRGIMNFSHAKLSRVMPVLSVPEEHMFIRGYNAYNDSRQKEGIRPVKLPLIDAETAAAFKRDFNVDQDHIRTVYGR